MATSQQTSLHTHVQCSPASEELAKACPNNLLWSI